MSDWILEKALRRLVKRGTVTLIGSTGRSVVIGEPDPGFSSLTVRLRDRGVGRSVAMSPRLGLAEAYMDGRITIEGGDIRDFITLVRANNPWEREGSFSPPGAFGRAVSRIMRWIDQINLPGRSQRNVAHHYDLSGQLYDLFLDRDRQYSCAYFASDTASLEDAQLAKKAHIAAKLALKPGQRVLDIGCGWGGMALYLHRVAGVDVTGITLSQEQLKVAQERAAAAGVSDHVRFELIDYRAMTGRFDRIVSVGMFEHVGVPHYREFFRTCRNLLTEDGVMLLHTIGRMGGPGRTDDFTRKYIFPGGYIPALSEMMTASEPNRLMLTDVEVLRVHYGKTLDAWYDRTVANREAIEALYDARFFRLWTFYLAGAMAAFRYGGMVNFQLQYARNRHSLPLTRDYIAEQERMYLAQESR